MAMCHRRRLNLLGIDAPSTSDRRRAYAPGMAQSRAHTEAGPPADIGVLGPLLLRVGEAEIALGSPQQQVVFALMVLSEGRQVPLEVLVDGLWGEEPPRSATTTVRTYISRLRATLSVLPGAPQIEARALGYVLNSSGTRVDLSEFRTLVARARDARAAGQPDDAAAGFAAALALWRGPAVAGLPGPVLEAQRRRLHALRDAAVEEGLDADISRGFVERPLADLEVLLQEQPLRERLWELRMEALWRAGRTADALAAFQQARGILDEELAIDPGPALKRLHDRILVDDRPEAAPSPPTVAPATAAHSRRPYQLPAPPAGFTARSAELAWLDEAAADRSIAVTVTISGLAGVGKTALALRWAHTVESRFPEGVLYVNLRGFDPAGGPLTPADVARWFAESLGAAPGDLPAHPEAVIAHYRTLIAGRSLLIVLDNARDADQVRPLLSGTAGPLVLVTSRNPLAGLVATHGARHLAIEPFTTGDAQGMLAQRLGAARVDEDPDAVDELVQRSGGLPLALAVLAARGILHPRASLAAIAGDLRTRGPSLEAFTGADPTTDIRAVLSWSTRWLDEPAETLMRAIALHPGASVSRSGAASAAGLDVPATESALRALLDTQLAVEPQPGRFAQHDLVRAFALEHVEDGEQEEVLGRVLAHVAGTAARAVELLAPERVRPQRPPLPDGVVPEVLHDARDATEWFEAERENLAPILSAAFDHGFDDELTRIARALQTPQDHGGRWAAWVTTQELVLRSARRRGDREAEGATLHNLGIGLQHLGRSEEACDHWRRAAELFRASGDHRRLANTLVGLATLASDQAEVEPLLREAVVLAREAGSLVAEAGALNNLGLHLAAETGRGPEAVALLERSRYNYLAVGAERMAAVVRTNRAWAVLTCGGEDMQSEFRQTAAIFARLGDNVHEAEALLGLGTAAWRAGLPATDAWSRAWELLPEEAAADPDVAVLRTRLQELRADSSLARSTFLPGNPR